MNHRCPGGSCGRSVPPNQLACRACWYRLPVELRSAIWKAWRDSPVKHRELVAEAIQWFKDNPA